MPIELEWQTEIGGRRGPAMKILLIAKQMNQVSPDHQKDAPTRARGPMNAAGAVIHH
jgi:hypothetical protein